MLARVTTDNDGDISLALKPLLLSGGGDWREFDLSAFRGVGAVHFRKVGSRNFALVEHGNASHRNPRQSAIDLNTGETAKDVIPRYIRYENQDELYTLDSTWSHVYSLNHSGDDHINITIFRRDHAPTREVRRERLCDLYCEMEHHLSTRLLYSPGGGVFAATDGKRWSTKLHRLDMPRITGTQLPYGRSHFMRDNNIVVSYCHASTLEVIDLRQPDRIASRLPLPGASFKVATFVSDNIVVYDADDMYGAHFRECAFDLRGGGLIYSHEHPNEGDYMVIVPH